MEWSVTNVVQDDLSKDNNMYADTWMKQRVSNPIIWRQRTPDRENSKWKALDRKIIGTFYNNED